MPTNMTWIQPTCQRDKDTTDRMLPQPVHHFHAGRLPASSNDSTHRSWWSSSILWYWPSSSFSTIIMEQGSQRITIKGKIQNQHLDQSSREYCMKVSYYWPLRSCWSSRCCCWLCFKSRMDSLAAVELIDCAFPVHEIHLVSWSVGEGAMIHRLCPRRQGFELLIIKSGNDATTATVAARKRNRLF